MIYLTELNERCDAFIKDARITVSQFCQQIGLSREGYYSWRDGELNLTQDRLNSIEAYLNSKEAHDLLEKARTFLPVVECENLTGLKSDKIRKLCKDGVIGSEQSSGNRYFVNVEDLKRYLQKEHPNVKTANKRPEDQMLAFGNLHSGFNVMWKPVLSCNNDHEIFFTDRYEYDNRYWIANAGYVYNTATGEILGTDTDCESYVRINLLKNGVREITYLHILVAYHFCPNGHFKDCVHHIDGNKQNNNSSNLLWVTSLEHKKCHRLMETDTRAYRRYVNKIKRENKW